MADGRMILIPPRREGHGRYRMIVLLSPMLKPPNILPYYGTVVLVIAGMGAILAAIGGSLAPVATRRRPLWPGRSLRARRLETQGRNRRTRAIVRRNGRPHRHALGRRTAALARRLARASLSLGAAQRRGRSRQHKPRSAILPRPHQRDIDRLSPLVNELLQLTARRGQHASALEFENVSLSDLLADVTEDCAPRGRSEERPHSPSCGRSLHRPRRTRAFAPRRRKRRAQRDSPHADGTTVEITLQPSAAATSITVRDHGPGVPGMALRDFPAVFPRRGAPQPRKRWRRPRSRHRPPRRRTASRRHLRFQRKTRPGTRRLNYAAECTGGGSWQLRHKDDTSSCSAGIDSDIGKRSPQALHALREENIGRVKGTSC